MVRISKSRLEAGHFLCLASLFYMACIGLESFLWHLGGVQCCVSATQHTQIGYEFMVLCFSLRLIFVRTRTVTHISREMHMGRMLYMMKLPGGGFNIACFKVLSLCYGMRLKSFCGRSIHIVTCEDPQKSSGKFRAGA